MKAWLKAWTTDRRSAQSGATLVELLVAVTIIGFAVVMVVGTFSTGLIDATLAKRNTALQAIIQYELDRISGSQFNASAQPYSECFATENSTAPYVLANYQGACPSGTYTLRADVTVAPGPQPGSQQWTVAVATWPGAAHIGTPVSVYKVNR